MVDGWIDDLGMVQCPRCEQVFPVDAKNLVQSTVMGGNTLMLRVRCPNCENFCRVQQDELAFGMR